MAEDAARSITVITASLPPVVKSLAGGSRRPTSRTRRQETSITAKVLLAIASQDVEVRDLLPASAVVQSCPCSRPIPGGRPRRTQATSSMLMMLDALIFRAEAEVRWLDACDARFPGRDISSGRRGPVVNGAGPWLRQAP